MDQNSWATHCIEKSLAKLTLSTKCIKQSASFLLTMPEHADLMSKLWFQAFKSAVEPAMQLSLLYVLNEIILKCTSYGVPEVKNSFKEPIVDAMKVLRPGLLIKKVKKLVLMWVERGLFDRKFTHQLTRISNNLDKCMIQNNPHTESEEATAIKEFAPDKFISQLRGFKQMDETIVNYSESDLAPASFSLPIDAILSRVKSKKEGQSFSRQVTTYTNQLEEALSNMDRKLSAQEALLKNIDKAMLFYSAQQKEAAVVTNAYKSYEQQVRNTLSTICNESGISEADKSPVAVEMATDDDDAEPVVSSLQATDAAPPKFFEDDDEEDGVDAGGGGASDMSEEEDEGNPDPFGIRRQISTSTIDIKDLLVDPKSLSHLPFSNFIFTDDRGDVDYRPMFAKMVASKFATTKEAVGENPRGTDTRAAKEVLDEETVDENMDLSDDGDAGAVEGKTSVSNASALTETGDFDYRQPVVAQGGKCENEDNSSNGDPFGLGKGASRGQDSDLRFPKSSVTEQPPLVGDSDYRQFPHPPKQSLPSTTSASLSWETNGDSDLRQRQVATAAAAAAASMYNTAIANAVAAQSLLFAPPPPPQPLFVPLLTPQTAPVLPTVLPQAQTLPVPVTSSVITCHQNHQSEASVSAPLVSSPHKHQIPVTTSTFTMQQPYPSAAASTASAHVCLPNISPDLLSTLKKINLPAVSSSAKSPERPNASPSSKPTAAPSQSDAVTKLLQQKHSASIKTEPEKLQGEDPFTIISRLTGLSNLIQCVKPAHESAPSQPVEIPTTMATSSSDSEKPLATVLDAQTTPNYSEDSSEEEDNVIGKEAHSTSLITPSASGVIGGDGDLEEEEEGDGGDTPTQDESEVSREAAPAPNCFPYQQAGLGAGVLTQPNFSPLVAQKPMGPPPLPGNPNNLLLSFPMGMPPPFNPLGVGPNPSTRLPWQPSVTGTSFGGGAFPPPAFFPNLFTPVLNQPPFPTAPSNMDKK